VSRGRRNPAESAAVQLASLLLEEGALVQGVLLLRQVLQQWLVRVDGQQRAHYDAALLVQHVEVAGRIFL